MTNTLSNFVSLPDLQTVQNKTKQNKYDNTLQNDKRYQY